MNDFCKRFFLFAFILQASINSYSQDTIDLKLFSSLTTPGSIQLPFFLISSFNLAKSFLC